MRRGWLVAVVVIVIVMAIGFVVYNRSKKPVTTTSSSSSSPSNSTQTSDNSKSSNCPNPPANTISYCDGAFTTLTVTAGTTVTVRNDSSSALDFDSDPHPTHTINPQLNAGEVEPGESKTTTLTTKGSWGFHNHEIPTDHGTITVQ